MREERELPPGWASASLLEVAPSTRVKILPDREPGSRFIGMDAVEAHTMRLLGTVDSSCMKSAAVLFEPGDVLYGRLRPYLNKVFAPDFRGLASAEFIPLTPVEGVAARFILYRLNSSEFVRFSSRLDEGDRPRVSYEQIGGFLFGVPPSPEQNRIVEALDSYLTRLDAAEQALRRAQANLKRYRASVLKAAVEGRLVPTEAELARQEGREYEPASVLLLRILAERKLRWEKAERAKMKAKGIALKDDRWKAKYEEPAAPDVSGLAELPEGWCWATVDQLAQSMRNGLSTAPHETAGVRILRISAVRPLSVNLGDVRFLPPPATLYESFNIADGDLLFTRYNGNPALVGVCGVVSGLTTRTVYPDKLIRVRLIEPLVQPHFIEIAVNTASSRRHLELLTRTTAGQLGISGTDLKNMPVPLAPLEEQVRISECCQRLLTQGSASRTGIGDSLARIARLRQSILKWAFEGRLVDQDPNDEPAAALLARIRAARAGEAVAAGGTARGRPQKVRA